MLISLSYSCYVYDGFAYREVHAYVLFKHDGVEVAVMIYYWLLMSFVLSIYVLQSSRDKIERFVRETVAESSMPGGVAKVE
ncbi:hypothetical protein L1987_03624 [Smallanthus sonchifolius]|uniref:Uncharacterized protein n=1 Tax=Smallanthus sonchifolius TaxID=185202 RepID=A0ACB9KB53_9ASTR|nr:hypothetical protein L1987_03624 [Smallanthus sonchifolius]